MIWGDYYDPYGGHFHIKKGVSRTVQKEQLFPSQACLHHISSIIRVLVYILSSFHHRPQPSSIVPPLYRTRQAIHPSSHSYLIKHALPQSHRSYPRPIGGFNKGRPEERAGSTRGYKQRQDPSHPNPKLPTNHPSTIFFF